MPRALRVSLKERAYQTWADERARDAAAAESAARTKADARLAASMSLLESHRHIRAALSLPCPSCAAERGSYCFSGHGFCMARWQKGIRLRVPAPEPAPTH